MEQNKIRKYLLYATGEILLVVIGILIALQVNNWNEEWIVQKEVDAILLNLNNEFSENLTQLNQDLVRLDSVLVGLNKILVLTRDQNYDLKQEEFDRLLENTFTTPSWIPSNVVLEELKFSGGFSRLNDESLKRLLFDWERHFLEQNDILEAYDNYAEDYIQYLTEKGSVRTLDAIASVISDLKPSTIANNDISMLKDPLFENRVDNFYFLAYRLQDVYKESATKMGSIIEQTSTK
jgi:hypothetical protein